MKATDKQIKWMKLALAALLVAVLSFLGISYPQPEMGGISAQAVTGAVRCSSPGSYGQCFRAENGGDIGTYSDNSTQTYYVDGATGNVTQNNGMVNGTLDVTGLSTFTDVNIAGTITTTNLISSSAGFVATGATTLVTTTVGSGGVGTATFHAPVVLTDTITLPAASIADAALSANVPLKNGASAFTGNNVFGSGGTGTTTFHAGVTFTDTVTLPAASIADAALSSNVPLKNGSNTFGAGGVGTTTFHAPVVFTDTVTLPAASIADVALSANVPLLNGANAFTAAQTMVTTTVGSGGVGSATFHAPVTFTDTVTFPATAIADAALSSNIPLKNGTNVFTGANTFGSGGSPSTTFHSPVVVTDTFSAPSILGTTVNATSTLQIGSVAFTGPLKYGTAGSYTENASIMHGFSVTPTMCLLWPTRDVTSTYTITATGFSSNRATMAETVYWMCGQ